MKTRILAVLFSFIPASLFSAPTIIGQWELTTAQPEMSPPEYVWFNADGTFSYIAVAAMEEPEKGRYQVQGNRITFSGATLYGAAQGRIVRLEASKLVLELTNDSGGLETYEFHRASQDPAKPSPSTSPSYSVQDHIQVQWQGSWYPAVILKIEGNKYLIHYDGYESSWDEWVTEDRMKR